MHNRWGPERRDDFWTSLAHGEVDTPELRAMTLLESICDEYRFRLYSFTAEMPAMGNVTGAMYVIQKQGGVIELDSNGTPCGHWCISIGPHSPVPGTDNVVVLKAMIEGEESEFRRIGNRSNFHGGRFSDAPGIVNPHAQDWIPRDQQELARRLSDNMDATLPDLFDLPDMIEVLEVEHEERLSNATRRMVASFAAMQRASEDWISPDRLPAEWYGMRMGNGLMEIGNRNAGRRVRYDPNAMADLNLDPTEALDLYGGEEARDDLNELRRLRAREERAFLGVEVEGRQRDAIEGLRERVAREVRRTMDDAEDGPRGIRLRDGTMLNWDAAEAQDVYMRTGIVVADEIHRMNNEGYNAEMIRFAMLEYFGVHQVYVNDFNGAQQEYPGQYMTAAECGVRGIAYPGEVVIPAVRGPIVRAQGNGQFLYV